MHLAWIAALPCHQNGQRFADLGSIELCLLLAQQGLQGLQPLILYRFRQMTVHFGRRRAGPRGVFERIGDRIAHIADELHRRLEIRVALAWKSDNKVRGYGDVRPGLADTGEDVPVVVCGVTTVHGLENAV